MTPDEIKKFNKKYRSMQADDYTVKKNGIIKNKKKHSKKKK